MRLKAIYGGPGPGSGGGGRFDEGAHPRDSRGRFAAKGTKGAKGRAKARQALGHTYRLGGKDITRNQVLRIQGQRGRGNVPGGGPGPLAVTTSVHKYPVKISSASSADFMGWYQRRVKLHK